MTTPARLNRRLKARYRPEKRGIRISWPTVRLNGRISKKEILDFIVQLATMSQARLPLTRSLEILMRQQKRASFAGMIESTLGRVRAGESLSDSLARFPRHFGPVIVNIIRVGEISGTLPFMLGKAAEHLEKSHVLRRKVIGAMTYPSVIVLVAVGAVGFLVFGVMPSFAELFENLDAAMPLAARLLLAAAEGAQRWWWLVLAGLGLIGAILRRYLRSPGGRRARDRAVLKLPLTGPVFKKIAIARFTHTLGMLLKSGVPLLDALDVTARATGNIIVAESITGMREGASRGEPIESYLNRSRLFPEMVVQMIAVGEETSELATMLEKTAAYYEGEVDAAVEMLTSLIEPIIIVLLGIILGGMIIAVYSQIFDLMNVIH